MTQRSDYLLGIKGVGMTALAACLIDAGHQVSGTDSAEDFVTASQLKKLAISIDVGYTHPLPQGISRVVISSALDPHSTPIIQDAVRRAVPIITHAQALGELSQPHRVVAVCGVGGKSTVSACLAHCAIQQAIDCNYAVGVGEIVGLERTGRYSPHSEYFIIEADEYADNPYAVKNDEDQLVPRFSFVDPYICICTNLQFDHPDVYKSIEQTKDVFFTFFQSIEPHGYLIWNGEDPHLPDLVDRLQSTRPDITCLSYGFGQADFPLSDVQMREGSSQARCKQVTIQTQLPGRHNLLNACATYIASQLMSWDSHQTLSAINSFRSTVRRCQRIKQIANTIYYDDYAHHPHEIQAILTALHAWYPRHLLVAVFQPHTVSRSKQLLSEFSSAFTLADQAIILPVFASAREVATTADSSLHHHLANSIAHHHSTTTVVAVDSLDAARQLIPTDQVSRIVVTLGAGDVYTFHDSIR